MTHKRERPRWTAGGADEHYDDAHRQYTPSDLLLPQLSGVRRTGPGRWIARCPAHYDRHPSLSARELPDGTLLIRCWAGCTAADVVAATGLTLADLFPRREDRGPLRRGERWVPADVLRCLSREALVALCAAEAVRRGDALNDDDMQRLSLAAGRLRDAAGEVGHG